MKAAGLISVDPRITFFSNNGTVFLEANSTKQDYYNMYRSIPELSAIINYIATTFTKPDYKLYRIDKNFHRIEEVISHPVLSLLQKPNHLQTKNEFQVQGVSFKKIYGNNYKYIAFPFGLNAGNYERWVSSCSMWNLPPDLIEIQVSKKTDVSFFDQRNMLDIVESFKFCNVNLNKDILDRIVIQNDTTLDFHGTKFVLGQSRIDNILLPLSNLKAAYENRNVLLNRKGLPLGLLTGDSGKDGITSIPLLNEEKQAIQNQLNRQYGMSSGQWKAIVTQASLSWTPMSLPIKDMLIEEGHKLDKIAICDQYQFPILLLNELSGSTFSNMGEAHKLLYNNVILPDFEADVESTNDLLKTRENGYEIAADFSKIEALQSDMQKKITSNDIISKNILLIANEYNSGNISHDTAISLLVDIWGLSMEQALKTIPGNTK
jgi:phage portal protein BeeE